MKFRATGFVGAGVCAILLIGWLYFRNSAVEPVSNGDKSGAQVAPISLQSASAVPALNASPPQLVAVASQPLPSLKKAYGSEHDLWAFAHAAADTGNSADTYEAWTATNFCRAFGATSTELKSFVEGKKSMVIGALTPERVQAINEIKLRCKGFEQEGDSQTAKFAKQQKELLNGTPFAVSKDGVIPVSQLRAMLSSDSPDAVAGASGHLLKPWMDKLQVPDNDPREDELALAVAMSRCELGVDCSVNGTQSLEKCAYAGVCGQDIRDVMNGIQDQQRLARINSYRQQLIEAVKNRNWAAIGLTGE